VIPLFVTVAERDEWVKEELRREAIKRYFIMGEIAKTISNRGDLSTVEEWCDFHIAVANLPPKGSLK
jgi:hypothetical protein